MEPRLILASASAARAALLESANIAFEVRPARLNEESLRHSMAGSDARTIAMALAERKALSVSAEHGDALVIGADQTLVLGTLRFDKAPDLGILADQMRHLRGRRHTLISAVAIARNGDLVMSHADEARLVFRAFSDEFLSDYLERYGEEVIHSVGGYRLEAEGSQLFESVDGDFTTILGLPLLPVLACLRDEGVIAT